MKNKITYPSLIKKKKYYQCWNVEECQWDLPNRDNIPTEDLRAGSSVNTTQEWGSSRDRMS